MSVGYGEDSVVTVVDGDKLTGVRCRLLVDVVLQNTSGTTVPSIPERQSALRPRHDQLIARQIDAEISK